MAVLSRIVRFLQIALSVRINPLQQEFIAEIDIFTTLCCGLCNVKRVCLWICDLKPSCIWRESRHFGRSILTCTSSTLNRQRLEGPRSGAVYIAGRTVALTETGEELRVFAQQTLLQYQQLRHTLDQRGRPFPANSISSVQ